FTINFFAIIPLTAILSFTAKQISITLGKALKVLLNATFSNTVKLIISIITLKEGHIKFVQSSILSSILSNLLLVMGICFFLGGFVTFSDS
ncbi:hypothetical protein LZ31DRAFT_469557, partial [Colletotrichum somersetense]